ncbi:MAG: pentaheme c-type cytochrome TorC [Neisseriaceae bacterium]|nr:pentaheme c-type cytochrome TorC [Neisseriaceae bacterium]
MIKYIKNIWQAFCQLMLRPASKIGLGVLVTGGFIAGMVAWQSLNVGMAATNQEAFCIGCHTMKDTVYPELQKTVHWQNRSGVRAQCADCHVPHDFNAKMARKMQASREVLSHLMGDIGTPEKFEEHRIVLAQREWARFKANGSKECKSCHDYKSMDFDKMRITSQVPMRQAAANNQSCLDCHQGIAHKLPAVKSLQNPAFDALLAEAKSQNVVSGQAYFAVLAQDIFADPELTQKIGAIEMATGVIAGDTQGNAQQVNLNLWRKDKGYGRVLYGHFAKNIVNATLEKTVSRSDAVVTVIGDKTDDMTGLTWQEVKVTAWMKTGGLVGGVEPIWSVAKSSYTNSCSVCHRQPKEDHFDANTWPGLFNGMVGFTSMDTDTAKLVLKYLQNKGSDASTAEH